MWPRYILLDNSTEFKNTLMDQVLKQLGIERIFSAPYHPQSNGKLEVFHKYLKPTLKKLCERDPSNWDKYINQVLASYRVTPNLATAETPFFSSVQKGSKFTITSATGTLAVILGRPRFWNAESKVHQLTLAITTKMLDENCFKTAQMTMDRTPSSFKIEDRVYFKNKQPSKWDLKWRLRYRIVQIEHDGHFLHIENQAMGKYDFAT